MKTSVVIRAVVPADQAAFVSACVASKRHHHPWVTAPCDAQTFVNHLERFDNQTNFGFVVCLAGTGQLVGAINLTNVVYGVFRSGYLGYYAFAGHQGRGHMKQGLEALARHAFTKLRLHRLEANIQPGNVASIGLVRSCGFVQEGYSPAYLKLRGQWRDHERWALVRGRSSAG